MAGDGARFLYQGRPRTTLNFFRARHPSDQVRQMKSFQAFRLDTANQCLWRGQKRVAISPKPYDMLRYLVENPGRLITQDELLEKLWPEIYVNPELIRKYILDIRKILG